MFGTTSLWRYPGMPALLMVTLLGFASYFLTLASLPAYAVQGGAGVSTAGAVTAIFLVVTIAGQSLVPALTARFGLAPVLTAGLLALGAPGPLYALADDIVPLAVISAVRGAGFGVLTVLGSTLASQIAPPERRGESIGLYSLAIGVPNLIAVPAGVALVLDGHPGWLSWLSASPVLALPFVPALVRAVSLPRPGKRNEDVGRRAVLAALPPSAVLLMVTLATGGVVTFLPIERPDGALASTALLVFGITGAITRWRSGRLADRIGSRVLLPLSLLTTAVGMAVLAAGLGSGTGWVLTGAGIFGAGYGAVQNLTLLSAFARAGEGGATAASAMWNASFDAGTAIGALALGLVVAGFGLPWTFVLSAGLLLASLPLAVQAARSRP
jgi:predicted MFS family arabinose efflux permease